MTAPAQGIGECLECAGTGHCPVCSGFGTIEAVCTCEACGDEHSAEVQCKECEGTMKCLLCEGKGVVAQ